MSSSPPPEDARTAFIPPRPRRRPLTLRAKLVISIVGLITAVCVVVGVATEIFLSQYLVSKLDSQVMQVNQAGNNGDGRRDGDDLGLLLPCAVPSRPAGEYGQPSGLGLDNLTAAIVGNQVVSAGIINPKATGGCSTVPSTADDALLALPTDGSVQTVSIPGYGDYRAAASNRSGVTVITGMPLAPVRASLVQLGLIMAIVTGLALIAGAVVVIWIVRRSLRPLDRVAATARQVSTLPLDRGEVELGVRVPDEDTDPRTEVGQVGAALNQMLGHVSNALAARQESEMRVRQFVADASHELRTPLAAIRGYAELARREEDDTEGVAHALRRVESESARMTTLVDDLLLLARLDSGRPLSADEVDLTMLAVDAVSDARVAGPGHRWQLDLPEEPVVTIGDQSRLHQVLVNLLANARTHTPPGTTVLCGLRSDNDGSVITVTDNGPGIPTHLQPEIFNRFVRGDSSRSRAAGSTGLGLAIVAAVTAAHGGSVSVDSQPGMTRFTVHLPRRPPVMQAPPMEAVQVGRG